MSTAVFTILSPNYRHFARVLMASLRASHPDWERFVLLVGDTAAPADTELFTTVSLDALDLPDRGRFTFRYNVLELNTAVKPWMFAHLFARGYDRVVYLDPDIYVYSPLHELDAVPPDSFITLTPHLTGFIGGEDHPSERTILVAGTYNLGFLAVSRRPQLASFLDWWKGKLEHECVVEPDRGLFVDQKWIDLVPGLFRDVFILRHDGYNVAYWNLRQRAVANGAAWTVNGQPLRFFHFSGYDPRVPELLSSHQPSLKLAATGDVRRLADEYGARLREAGSDSFRNAPYAFGAFEDGRPIPDAARAAYRDSDTLQHAAGTNPFARPELFRGFRDARRRPSLAARAALITYRVLSSARPLVLLLPKNVRTSLRERLLGRKERTPSRGISAADRRPGINVVGYAGRETGVGESARLFANACDAAGLPNRIIDVDWGRDSAARLAYRTSILHVNADRTQEVRSLLKREPGDSTYTIACWHWELPELPDALAGERSGIDEFWAPSAFVQSAISRKVNVPVVHMPHGVEVTALERFTPQDLGVPDRKFTFLCMLDFDSVVERKNPLAALAAFHRAFAGIADCALLIKTANADRHPAAWTALREAVDRTPNAHLVDRTISRAAVNGLIDASDAVVSLHRSEGFGLILAEAMSLGKPVIATGWSGNMDFMDAGNSCPVAFDLVTLDRDHGPYAAGQTWAEPDAGHAAELMQRIARDADFRTRIAARGRETIRSRFSPRAAGLRYRERLEALGLLG